MNELIKFIENNNIEIILGLMAGLLFLLILFLISQIRIGNIKKKYNTLVNGTKNMNIEELLIQTGKDINGIGINMNIFEEKINGIETRLSFAIQKVGIVRYNAFAEMGSDLSFSIALLDNFQSGFVLTSIYGRSHSSIYAKPVKFGKSEYPLSVEEIQAIDRAKLGESKEIKI